MFDSWQIVSSKVIIDDFDLIAMSGRNGSKHIRERLESGTTVYIHEQLSTVFQLAH